MYFGELAVAERDGHRRVARSLFGLAAAGALLLASLVGATPRAMAGTVAVDCLGADGMVFSQCTGPEIATDADIPTTLTDTWYIVTGVIDHVGSVSISGNVRIVLANGASLTITGDAGEAGIGVPAGSQLTITSGTGTPVGSLTVTGGDSAAGIGGGDGGDAGTIVIYGGTIDATGGSGGAGIGGGASGNAGPVTIEAATVTATGGAGAPAIGPGDGGNPSTIIMDSGTLTAIAGSGSQSLLGTFTTPGVYFYWTNTTTTDPGGDGLLVPPGTAFSNSSSYQFVKIDPAYQLTLQSATGGDITLGDAGYYAAGAVIDLEAQPQAGYKFTAWYSLYGGTFGDPGSPTTTFTMPRSGTTVIADFDEINNGPGNVDTGGAVVSWAPLGLVALMLLGGVVLLARKRWQPARLSD